MENLTQTHYNPTMPPSEQPGVVTIAKSVAMIAKTLSEIKKRLKDLEERFSGHEGSICESAGSRGFHARTRKADFWRTYKALVSVTRALNVVMTPDADNAEQNGNDEKRTRGFNDVSKHNKANQIDGSNWLKNIALALSDMETVASYVTQDEMSTASNTLSKPADYIKIENSHSNSGEIDETGTSSMDINHTTLKALRQLLLEKDEQLQKFLQETKYHSEVMQRRSRRWAQMQFFLFIVVTAGFYIWAKQEFEVHNGWETGRGIHDNVMTEISHNGVLHDHIVKHDETERDIVESVSYVLNYCESYYDGCGDRCADDHKFDSNITINDKTGGYKNSTMPSQIDELNVHESQSFVPASSSDINTSHENGDATNNDVKGESVKTTRSWIEKGICDELSDMMFCPERQSSVSQTRRKRLSHLDPRDIQTLQRMMVRRQVFTAIGVAMAMTLPQMAPHIFKLNLAQVLSISFWKSFMEFLTVFIQ
mmetsp:Transcript_4938/g.9423  ORF Transcript_4938/g.9423 Transcript_4938/m.9423 type:complete len:481 (+) Transcript_4938:135-1577(+)